MKIATLAFPNIIEGMRSIKEKYGPDTLVLEIKHNEGENGNKNQCEISINIEDEQDIDNLVCIPGEDNKKEEDGKTERRRIEEACGYYSDHINEGFRNMEMDMIKKRIMLYPLPIRSFHERLTRHGMSEKNSLRIVSEIYIEAGETAENGFKSSNILKSIFSKIIKTSPIVDHNGNIIVLGPSGAGKTQTTKKIAKLFHDREEPVLIVVYDPVKRGIFDEFMSFSEKTGIPFTFVSNDDDLHLLMANDKRRKILDISGRRDIQKRIVAKLDGVAATFVFSASTREEAINAYCSEFANVFLLGIIFTKIDEEKSVGHIFDTLLNTKHFVNLFTNGVEPDDTIFPDENAIYRFLVEGNLSICSRPILREI